MESSGVQLERRTTDTLAAGERLRPLKDKIVVKQLPQRLSKVIEIVDRERKALRGIVVAVGPGRYPWRYNEDRSKRWESKAFRRPEVKVGDVVALEGYSYPTILIENEVHFVCSEQDVTGVETGA